MIGRNNVFTSARARPIDSKLYLDCSHLYIPIRLLFTVVSKTQLALITLTSGRQIIAIVFGNSIHKGNGVVFTHMHIIVSSIMGYHIIKPSASVTTVTLLNCTIRYQASLERCRYVCCSIVK